MKTFVTAFVSGILTLLCVFTPLASAQATQTQSSAMQRDVSSDALDVASSYSVPRCGNTGSRVLLSYDDWSYGAPTRMVSQAKLLKSRGVGAMFFPVQQLNINYQNANGVNLVTQVRDQGQYVGNHTWSHLKLTNYGTATIKSQIGKGAGGYKSATSSPGYLRPPYGAYNATVKNIAESMDYHVCTWTLDTKDYAGKTASQICSYVKANAKPGSVVLMHLQTKAYDATNCIVNGLRAKGLSLCRPYKVNGVIARAPIRAPYPLQC